MTELLNPARVAFTALERGTEAASDERALTLTASRRRRRAKSACGVLFEDRASMWWSCRERAEAEEDSAAVSDWDSGVHSSDCGHERVGAGGRGLGTRVWYCVGVEAEITAAKKKMEACKTKRMFPPFLDMSLAKGCRREEEEEEELRLRERSEREELLNNNNASAKGLTPTVAVDIRSTIRSFTDL